MSIFSLTQAAVILLVEQLALASLWPFFFVVERLILASLWPFSDPEQRS